jgi:putative membrane protein
MTTACCGSMDGGMMSGGMMGWMFLWPLVGLLLLATVIVLSVLVVRKFWNRVGHSGRTEAALDVLRERFARGELDREEFESRRQVLEG